MKPIRLNQEQEKAIKDMIEFVADGTSGSAAFMGAAGTGKTTTLQHFARKFIELFGEKTILFITPTHKAASVLREKMPKGISVDTIAKTIGVKTKKNKDKEEFVEPTVSVLHKQAESLKERFPDLKIIIVDESSMVSQNNADSLQAIVDLCNHLPIVFSGDPFQLPPVAKKSKDLDQLETEEETEYSKNMCSQFASASYSIKLKKVERHTGPVFDYATSIRENFKQPNKFPLSSIKEAGSLIEVFDSEANWMQTFFEFVKKHSLKAKAITHKNNTCNKLTTALRFALYGHESGNGWMPGENITFPSYTILPSGERIYSCTDAQIKTAEIVEINKLFKEIDYLTPIKQLPRSLSISLQGQFQKLIIVSNRFPAELEVFVPLIGAKDMQEHRSQIRRKLTELANNDIIKSDCLVCAWDAMRQLNSYFPTIYSANVMTVHKSQGSSFDHVFVHKDVEECKADYSNALLYVAATRAKKGLYFLNP